MALPEKVSEEITLRVHSRDREVARDCLESCVTGLTPTHREQILLSIVRLAGRNMKKLRELVEVANEDYRNIEYWHGWPEENRERFFERESAEP